MFSCLGFEINDLGAGIELIAEAVTVIAETITNSKAKCSSTNYNDCETIEPLISDSLDVVPVPEVPQCSAVIYNSPRDLLAPSQASISQEGDYKVPPFCYETHFNTPSFSILDFPFDFSQEELKSLLSDCEVPDETPILLDCELKHAIYEDHKIILLKCEILSYVNSVNLFVLFEASNERLLEAVKYSDDNILKMFKVFNGIPNFDEFRSRIDFYKSQTIEYVKENPMAGSCALHFSCDIEQVDFLPVPQSYFEFDIVGCPVSDKPTFDRSYLFATGLAYPYYAHSSASYSAKLMYKNPPIYRKVPLYSYISRKNVIVSSDSSGLDVNPVSSSGCNDDEDAAASDDSDNY